MRKNTPPGSRKQPPEPRHARHGVLGAAMRTMALAGVVACLAPAGVAQIAGHGNANSDCNQLPLIGLLGVTSAGDVEACVYYPSGVYTNGGTFTASIILTAPAATGAGTASLQTTWTAVSGCSKTGGQNDGGPGGTGFGTEFFSYQRFTLSSAACEVKVEPLYKNGAGSTLYDVVLPFLVQDSESQVHGCNDVLTACNIARQAACDATDAATSNVCDTPQVDNKNRFCAASDYDAACVDPNVNTSLTSVPITWVDYLVPLLLAVLVAALLPRVSIFAVPGGVVLGVAIFLRAFALPLTGTTAYAMILLHFATGGVLALFSLYQIIVRAVEFKPEKRKLFE